MATASPDPTPPEEPLLTKGHATGHLLATERASVAHEGLSGAVTRVKHILIGRPMPIEELVHERITKTKALAVLSSDVISSTAYASEEILLVLAAAGAAALTLTVPITVAIILLLAIVVGSYRQTIRAYPKGGGTYIVTSDNLGIIPALIAGSALMIDYVLTVAVSVSAGVAAVTSAFPRLASFSVEMALLAVAFLVVANLRGVRESATLFTLPTYLFVISLAALLGLGAWRALTGLPAVEPVAAMPLHTTETLGIFLILRAFASGCSAITGTEAISDGVPIFREPQARNASTTLVAMAVILGTLFLGISWLAQFYHVLPGANETVISQLVRAVVGRGPFYYEIQAVTALILVLAANTAFSDFPRLAYFMARDRFMPRQFVFRGDRLALSTGVIALGSLAGLLILAVQADVHHLIPLYAVGVFLSFTFSQSSMVVRWWRRRERGWRRGIALNGLGAFTTAIVAVVITFTKFTHGAWMIVLLLPAFVLGLMAIHRHYLRVGEQLVLTKKADLQAFPLPESRTLVLVSSLNKATALTLRYALALSSDVTALHITDDPEEGKRFSAAWEGYNLSIPVVILESPYRSLVAPIMTYLDMIQAENHRTPVTVVISEFVPRHWWEFILHNQDALRLKTALFFRRNTAVVDVPYHLER